MESLGVYLFAGAFPYPASACRTQSRTHLHLPRSNGDWPGSNYRGAKNMLNILWTILIGFIAGVIAKLVTPGSTYEPQGFILTAALGIVGALVATYLGQALGWYQAGQGAGFIGSIVGAVLILLVWGFIASRRT
jgi:uncharacterized membrane protein YeaQ/YmgE (transglycosylase-associated protein family)